MRIQQKDVIFRRNSRGLELLGSSDRERQWGLSASRFLKAELKRAGIGYAELADRLTAHGMEETETSIAGKLSRASFGVAFFLASMSVIGVTAVEIAEF